MPKRIQITNRFMKNPPNTKRVTRPGKFSNPFMVERTPEAHAAAVMLFRALCDADAEYRELIRRELAGYHLACACPDGWPCHADVLLEIANTERHAPADDGRNNGERQWLVNKQSKHFLNNHRTQSGN